MFNRIYAALVLLVMGIITSPAYAVVDVTDITDQTTLVAAAAAVVGAAVLLIKLATKTYKWLTGTL